MPKEAVAKTRSMLVAGKDGRIETKGLKGQSLSDNQAMALAVQSFGDALRDLAAEIGGLASSLKASSKK